MIETRTDSKRGCGYRKAGGLYLISGGEAMGCGKFPLPLTICPTCSHGIKFSRGWTWIDADKLFAEVQCKAVQHYCAECPLSNRLIGKAGLLWIGEAFYKTPRDFNDEAMKLGISRRIQTVPHEFELGKTWVLFAHLKAIRDMVQEDPASPAIEVFTPAIFKMFKPTAIEYVVKGDETEEEIARLEKRGITCVRVETDEPKQEEIL